MYDGDNRATRPCLTSQDCHQRSDEVDSGFKTDLVSDGAVEGGSYGATPEECNCLEGHDLTSKIVREALLQLGGETCEPHRHSGVGDNERCSRERQHGHVSRGQEAACEHNQSGAGEVLNLHSTAESPQYWEDAAPADPKN